ncbi:MAG: type II toxin-antitoxin system VapB family antitoxin [Terracidiphilus sp.]|jgi:antitoxin VapB
MPLSIKNEEAERVVRELANHRGLSLVTAITQAARETLERDRAQSEGQVAGRGLAARLMEIARETGPLMKDGRTTKELFDELYDDETGLPK